LATDEAKLIVVRRLFSCNRSAIPSTRTDMAQLLRRSAALGRLKNIRNVAMVSA